MTDYQLARHIAYTLNNELTSEDPHDPQNQKNLKDRLGEFVDVDDVIKGLKTNQL